MSSEDMGVVPEWRIKVIPEYQKVISSVATLSTGSLILPLFFLRDLSGVGSGGSLWPYLSLAVYVSWSLLGISIFSGIIFQYFCAKWIKRCFGGEILLSFSALDKWLDIAFWGSAISFFMGLLFLVIFAVTLQHHGA